MLTTRPHLSAPKAAFIGLSLTASLCGAAADPFEGHGDVGATKHAGSAGFKAARGACTVAGGGANMWFTNDAFHFVWKKVAGEVTLAADIAILGTGGDPHRKACLLVRQSLDDGPDNVPSWSPDSRRAAFVSCQFVPWSRPVTAGPRSGGRRAGLETARGRRRW